MKEVVLTADKLKKRKLRYRRLKLILTIIMVILILIFIVLSIIYNGGRFTVTLDNNFSLESGIILYEEKEYKEETRKLYAKNLDFMDNISIDWIPKDIDSEAEGSHNGENYIAYTFYLENTGDEIVNYWYTIVVDDVIKNVDEAVRVMIYLNGERQVYGKINALTKEPEKDTKPFLNNNENEIILEERKDFKPKQADRFTVVVWLEGDDPDCVDAIIGGEIKMHMEIREEHLKPGSEGNNEKK